MDRIFVSHSTKLHHDKIFAAHLLSRLNQQDAYAWIYEHPDSAIPIGETISKFCMNEIRKSNWFISVISDSSLQSQYTQTETAFALKNFSSNLTRILPLVTTKEDRSKWPSVYQSLSDLKQCVIDIKDNDTLETFINQMCLRLNIQYSPFGDRDQRLPIIKRLKEEIDTTTKNNNYGAGAREILYKKAASIGEKYANGEFRAAYDSTIALIEFGLDLLGVELYYAKIVRGIIEIEICTPAEPTIAARRTFVELINTEKNGEFLDENAYAGLAFIEYREGNFKLAMENYRKALEFIKAPDPDIAHNIIICAATGDLPINYYDLRNMLDFKNGLPSMNSKTTIRLKAISILLDVYQGNIDNAITYIDHNTQSIEGVVDIFIAVAHQLKKTKRWLTDSALRENTMYLLNRFLEMLSSENRLLCLRLLMQCSFEDGRLHEALVAANEARLLAPAQPQSYVDCAICHILLLEKEKAKLLCQKAINLNAPLTGNTIEVNQFFYFSGFASWILHLDSAAKLDFSRSGFNVSTWYETEFKKIGAKR